jgi:hypothetical protein
MSRKRWNWIAVTAALMSVPVSVGVAAEKPERYQAYLSPMPHNDAMHANFSGKGAAMATLNGDTVSLSGAFTGLASSATKAYVCRSQAAGIPGAPILEVTVSSGVEGKVTGTFKLDKSQILELQNGKLYLQIDSEKAQKGNLWGWLLPEHESAGQDVPQKWPWFQPEFAVKTK